MARYLYVDGERVIRDLLGHDWNVATGGGYWQRWDQADNIKFNLEKTPQHISPDPGWYLSDDRPDGFLIHWCALKLLDAVDVAARLIEG